jgi:hypothetical protein
MDPGRFGEGSIALAWSGIEGMSGLQPRIQLLGKLIAKGYGIGAVVQINADVSIAEIGGAQSFIGTSTLKSYVLNWVKQEYVQENPPPPDETTWDVQLPVLLSPSVIEGIEERRQGKDFSFLVDITVLLIDSGELRGPKTKTHYATHPTRSAQDTIRISQSDWTRVLERWERGVGIPILLPLTAVEPNYEQSEIVRHLKAARQKIDGGDYSGSFECTRKALELLRSQSVVTKPLPKVLKDRDIFERVHAVIDALFSLASASLHVDGPIKDFEPARADAVALAGATTSIAQEVFAHLKNN